MNKVVYDSDGLQAIYAPGRSDYLLVTFSAANDVADGEYYWGKKFAEDNAISTIGIVAKRINGFPDDEIDAIREAASEVFEGHRDIVTFATSMGAYAALKHGRRLGASTAVAFAPFYAAAAEHIGEAESRRLGYVESEMRGGEPIRAEDLCPRNIVFYDPYFVEENKHAALIERVSPAIEMIAVPNTQHFPVALFAKSEARLTLIDLARRGDVRGIRELTQVQRKLSPIRIIALVEKIADNDPEFARNLLREYMATLFSQKDAMSGDAGYSEFRKATHKFAIRVSEVASRVGAPDLSLQCAQIAVFMAPASSAAHERLCDALVEAERFDEAEAAIRQAIAVNPGTAGLQQRLESLSLRRSSMPAAGIPA